MQLTDKSIRDLPAPVKGLKIHYDDKLSGFGVRITSAGYRSFVLRYRTKTGIQRTVARQSGWECGDKEDGFEAVAAR